MPKTHIVKQGETLSSIALEHGFRDFHTVFDDPANAELRATRDAHVLFPGDPLVIPDHLPKAETRPVDDSHRFVVKTSRLFLRLRLLDLDHKPLDGVLCEVALESGRPALLRATDGEGVIEERIPATLRRGEVVAHLPTTLPPPAPPEEKAKFDLRIGSLNPEFKLSGQQARLNNLGYFAGFALKDLDQLLWAAEEFACEKIAKPVTKRPKIQPAPLAGEDDETASDPARPTGITDAPIVTKLRDEHGI